MAKTLSPVSPGEILREEFLAPLGLSQNQLAKALGVNVARINDLVHGRRGVTADTALRLSAFFGTSPEFWMNLQSQHDLRQAEAQVGKDIRRQIKKMDAA